MRTKRTAWSWLIGLSAGAMGSFAWAGPEQPNVHLLEGQAQIYTITTMTENKESCEEKGGSVLASQTSRFFVLKDVGDARWGHYVYAVSCKDEASCQRARTASVGGDWMLMFNQRDSPSNLSGSTIFSGRFSTESCIDPAKQGLSLEFLDGGKVRIIKKTTVGPSYAPVPMSEGTPPMCQTGAAEKAVQGLACTANLVIEGVAKPVEP